MVYQICKSITALLPAFDGEPVDQVLLTGGMARSRMLVADITAGVTALGCGVTVYPGENEMYALVKGALRVLQGKETARVYARPDRRRPGMIRPIGNGMEPIRDLDRLIRDLQGAPPRRVAVAAGHDPHSMRAAARAAAEGIAAVTLVGDARRIDDPVRAARARPAVSSR